MNYPPEGSATTHVALDGTDRERWATTFNGMIEIEPAESTHIAMHTNVSGIGATASPLEFFYISTSPLLATQLLITTHVAGTQTPTPA